MKLPRNAQIWLPGYLRSRWRDRRPAPRLRGPSRIWLTIADHFEPYWHKPDEQTAWNRVALWASRWPEISRRNRDSQGNPAQYTFFYPQEEYQPRMLDAIGETCHAGCGEVEVHIHHDGEGRQNFLDRMNGFVEALHARHGLLHRENGKAVFGFIHGNWALDNSRPDGRCCGLNDEITLLRELGCYADFTMPSGPEPTQSRIVNTIYWANDNPQEPKSYDTGVPFQRASNYRGDLLMIPGPLGIRWRERLKPRMETGELAQQDMANAQRVRRWMELAPRIGDDVFIKLHTHGAQERNADALLNGGLDSMFQTIRAECDRGGHTVHYVTAHGMYRAVMG
ncbi:conserved hypothetical protein [Candidatus Sulfopaludibacter sp. SbA3]|nr:conserved hypothetical protein [Candidatus Sulfopaludibacter sp. SbA3]